MSSLEHALLWDGTLTVPPAGLDLGKRADRLHGHQDRAEDHLWEARRGCQGGRLAQARGYEVTVYEEVESAAKARPVLDRLLADARAGRVQAVAVWALDWLHRSMVGAIQTVLELDRLGVRVLSARESWLDTDSPVRPLLVAIFGWVAEQERTRLIERTKAGMARARTEGKKIGRPRTSPLKLAVAVADVQAGMSRRAAARRSGIPEATLRAHLSAQKRSPGGQA